MVKGHFEGKSDEIDNETYQKFDKYIELGTLWIMSDGCKKTIWAYWSTEKY